MSVNDRWDLIRRLKRYRYTRFKTFVVGKPAGWCLQPASSKSKISAALKTGLLMEVQCPLPIRNLIFQHRLDTFQASHRY